jgi:hypothetical protein
MEARMRKFILMMLVAIIACSQQATTNQVQEPTQAPTQTPYPTYTPYPTNTPEPTKIPEPTATRVPTSTPIPNALIWKTSLEDDLLYQLGYGTEIAYSDNDPPSKYIHFYDMNSYYESDYWYWYGNSVAVFFESPTGPADQISLYKNSLDFPVSPIDGRAERYFRNILDDFGFTDVVISEIISIMKTKLASARENLGDSLCIGQLSSGEHIAVELAQSDYGYYWYEVAITRFPMCDGAVENSA